MTTGISDKLSTLHAAMSQHLEEGIIPFWLEHSWDARFGGFITNFDQQGLPLETPEKYLNTQARLIWWFSALTRRYPERGEFRSLASRGLDFLIDHFWDRQRGGWYWKARRDGSILDEGKIVYGQSFAIYALSEYSLAVHDGRGLQLASDTFDLLQRYCADTLRGGYYENLEPGWKIAPGGFAAGDRKGLDTHLHLMESFTTLFAASGLEIHQRKLLEVTRLIVKYMVDPQTGCGRNQFDLDFNPIPAIAIRRTWNAEREGEAPAVPTDTTSYGHNIELSWLLNRALQTAGVDPTEFQPVMYRLLDHAYRHGIDQQYGGVYRDGLAGGEAVILDKEFWQNAEAMVGFLDGFETFGEERFLEALENIWTFVARHMILDEVGEWRTLLDRQGTPIDSKIGNPWKVAYHSGRSMLECTQRLSRLIEKA